MDMFERQSVSREWGLDSSYIVTVDRNDVFIIIYV